MMKMNVKEFIESEIGRYEEALKKLAELDTLIHRKESLIWEIRNANKASVDNFIRDWGMFFPWFEENFERFKNVKLDRNAPYYLIRSCGTVEERNKLWAKEEEIRDACTASYRLELSGIKAERDACISALGDGIEDIIMDDGEFSSESQIELILDYLKAVLLRLSEGQGD